MFDQACRRLDYRLKHENDDDDAIEDKLNELFYQDGKIYDFKESLAHCTDTYLCQVAQLDEDDNEKREILERTYESHRKRVELKIEELVRENLN